MKAHKKLLLLGTAFVLLSSCTCGTPLRVTPIQRSDKKLACKEVILEINEAENYRRQGASERGIGIGEALMPVCWITGYIDGDQAIKSADARIDYLGQVYDLLDCGGANNPNPPQLQPIIVTPPPPPPPPPAPIAPPSPQVIKIEPQFLEEDGDAEPAEAPYYKLLGKPDGPFLLHEHKDKCSKVYVHSHPHQGPHKHLEDTLDGKACL